MCHLVASYRAMVNVNTLAQGRWRTRVKLSLIKVYNEGSQWAEDQTLAKKTSETIHLQHMVTHLYDGGGSQNGNSAEPVRTGKKNIQLWKKPPHKH